MICPYILKYISSLECITAFIPPRYLKIIKLSDFFLITSIEKLFIAFETLI